MTAYRQEFGRALEAIEAKVIELFAMVAEDLPGATNALLSSSNEVLGVLAERQQVIHALYPQIEKQVNREILLQAPVAGDLRFLLSVLRILPDLERSHHSVVEIASRANRILSQDLSPRARGLVERMGNLVSGMWRQAADSWYQRDRSAAFTLAARDQEMDELTLKLDSRTCLRTNDTAGGGGDDAGGVLLRASCRPRRQHRPPGDLPGRISDRLARWASSLRQRPRRSRLTI